MDETVPLSEAFSEDVETGAGTPSLAHNMGAEEKKPFKYQNNTFEEFEEKYKEALTNALRENSVWSKKGDEGQEKEATHRLHVAWDKAARAQCKRDRAYFTALSLAAGAMEGGLLTVWAVDKIFNQKALDAQIEIAGITTAIRNFHVLATVSNLLSGSLGLYKSSTIDASNYIPNSETGVAKYGSPEICKRAEKDVNQQILALMRNDPVPKKGLFHFHA